MFRMLTAARALRAWNALFGDDKAIPAKRDAVLASAVPSHQRAGVFAGDEGHAAAPTAEALAILGHELRTPLAALMGYTEMLAGADRLTEEQRRAWSASAHAAASHLNALVASVLESGVAGLGAPSSGREIVDASALAAGCCDFVRPDASARGVSLYGPFPGSGPDLHCDPRAIRQVLLNLLSNAIKFTPPGGEVRLETKLEGGRVMLVVTDTGIGFDEARRRQAAARPDAARAGTAGLGLGLLLVRSLVSLHGGEAFIQSGGSAGTVARVALPSGSVAPVNETSAGPTCASHMMVPCLA